ncbi:MAG TPA: hypothetical protein PLD93_01850, partial [Synergistaceae bacterium]|nr:hypothetical protein [Synergistaceae bacterium]
CTVLVRRRFVLCPFKTSSTSAVTRFFDRHRTTKKGLSSPLYGSLYGRTSDFTDSHRISSESEQQKSPLWAGFSHFIGFRRCNQWWVVEDSNL